MIGKADLHCLTESGPSDAMASRLLDRPVGRAFTEITPECLVGRRIMITGGCGTIGLALAQKSIELGVERVALIDNSEAAMVAAIETNTDNRIRFILGDADGGGCFRRALARFEVDTIVHAAAYKHLRVLESDPVAAIFNNINNTWRCLQAAHDEGVGRFVLVSTDKACKPSSVLGASKRLAEECVAAFDRHHDAIDASSLRIGNVLGSAGSALQIFASRLIAGKSLNISDPDARRFFVTANEASGFLVRVLLRPGDGRLFLANSGPSVNIGDLAKRLSDEIDPGMQQEFKTSGLARGEKIDEELIADGIAYWEGEGLFSFCQDDSLTMPEFENKLTRLWDICQTGEAGSVCAALTNEVSTH